MKKARLSLIIFSIVAFFIMLLQPNKISAVNVSGYSAILMEQETGRVLYEKKAHERQRIDSITKIMTAIIAIELGDLKEKVKISERASLIEGSSIYLNKGDEVTLEDLLYGLMLRSGNDAAVAIAEHIGGSVDGFVYLMNEKAEQLQMDNTVFANPHGLDDSENHFSTPYDMAILTRYAMLNETFREISATKKYKTWGNKNRLLTDKYKYCTGGKTGFTERAKRTLVTTATKNDLDLIAVTLNAPNDWDDHQQMFEFGFETFEKAEILSKGEITAIPKSIYDEKVYVNRSYYYPIKSDEADHFKIHYKIINPEDYEAHNRSKKIVGKAEIYFKENIVSEIPLYHNVTEKEDSKFKKLFRKIFSSFLGVSTNG